MYCVPTQSYRNIYINRLTWGAQLVDQPVKVRCGGLVRLLRSPPNWAAHIETLSQNRMMPGRFVTTVPSDFSMKAVIVVVGMQGCVCHR